MQTIRKFLRPSKARSAATTRAVRSALNSLTWTVYDSNGDVCACGFRSRRDAEAWFPRSMECEYKVLQDGRVLDHGPA